MKINWLKVLQLTAGVTIIRYLLGSEIAAGTFVVCLIIMLVKRLRQNKTYTENESKEEEKDS